MTKDSMTGKDGAESEADNHFAWLLGRLRRGRVLDECSEELRKLVEAVRDTGKAGSLTLQLKVSPASKGDAEMLTVEDKVAAKTPDPDRAASLFFALDGGGLSRNDPRQTEFPAAVFQKGKREKEEGKSREA